MEPDTIDPAAVLTTVTGPVTTAGSITENDVEIDGPTDLTLEDLPLRLVENDPTPLYLQIVQQLRQLIMTRRLPDGAQLPAVRRLAAGLAVNPGTVAQAYRDLATDGLVESVRGRGTMVRHLSGASLDDITRDRLLDECLVELGTRALALGFDQLEIRHRLGTLLMADRITVPVVFVGGTAAQAERYAASLNELFAPARLDFRPHGPVESPTGRAALLADLRTAWTVVTFVTAVPDAERFLARHGIEAEIIGVTAELSAASRDGLARIDPDRSYTVVTEARVVTSVLAQIEQSSAITRDRLQVLTTDVDGWIDQRALAAVAASDSVLIFSFGVFDQIMALELPPHRLLELRFDLTPAALDQLRTRWS